ncbi:MAG: glycosyltransferase [Flavobacteriales bacterium]|nr:glycosyltransferase [Flavobacteriales bacterium]
MSDPKRILFLADINSTHTERWVLSLLGMGYTIALFSLSEKQKTWTSGLSNFDFKCFGISENETKSNSRFGKLKYFNAKTEVKGYFESFQPDIVHAHYASSYGTLARSVGFEKTILSLWGSDVYVFPQRSFIHKYLFKKAVKFAKIVCSTSEDMVREASKYVKRDYIVTPFGVDTDRFHIAEKSGNEQAEPLIIGTAKMLEEVYGIDRLIRLYSRFREQTDRPSKLLIYGRGSQKEALEKLSEELNVADFVSFEGFVSGEDLVRAYQSFDVFVSLSRRESFGVSTLEAQACGALAMVTNVGGLPEVTCSKTGRIVNEDDEENWSEALLELVEMSGDIEIKKRARDFVKSNFSEQVCVDKLIQVYENV